MKKIAVITGTRAEYGLLYWIMKEIRNSSKLTLQLIVTGMHLSPAFGCTYKTIEQDGFIIDKIIDMNLSSDASAAISKSMGLGMIGFAQAYRELTPDIILVLGDRYEILAAVSAAIPFNIPIAHIAGGEVSEGSTDEQIRHAITKMAHIHFPCADQYADNIVKMGENPEKVFRVGHPGLERIKRSRLINKEELFTELGLDLNRKTILVTLHPTTLNTDEQEEKEIEIFFKMLKEYANLNIVITYPNSDKNNTIIINRINQFIQSSNAKAFKNLGDLKYLSLMKECSLVLGNSSSAIVEAPFFRVPAVDYGDRQKGRLKAQNIIHANPDPVELKYAIDKALYDNLFVQSLQSMVCLYGEGETSINVVKALEKLTLNRELLAKKLSYEEMITGKKNEY